MDEKLPWSCKTIWGVVVVVVDNAPCHAHLESIFAESKFSGNAPYFPMFNPMENVWSSAKAKVKRDLTNRLEEILRNVYQGLTIKEHQLRALEELIVESMNTITHGMCANFVSRIFTKVADAINLVDKVY